MKQSHWLPWVVRMVGYVVLVVGAAFTPRISFNQRDGDPLFSEYTMLEGLQLTVLALAALLLCRVARQQAHWRRFSSVLALMLACAMVRELDFLLDQLADGSWQLLVSVLLFTAGWVIRGDLPAWRRQLGSFVTTSGFGLMLAGLLTTTVFSRVIGQGVFWERVMGDHYLRAVKNAAEESTELLGYTLILIGAIEFVLWVRRQIPHHQEQALR